MKKEVTIGQLLTIASMLFLAGLTGWINQVSVTSKQQVQIDYNTKTNDRILGIQETANKILYELKGKSDADEKAKK